MATNGPELSRYVTLISSDGFEFVVLREAVYVSGAIKRMLDPKSASPHFEERVKASLTATN
jgi:elongin-C